MKRDLPKHLYQEGTSYRAKLPDGRRVTLGTNRAVALQRFHVLMSPQQIIGAAEKAAIATDLWRRHRKGAKQRGIPFDLEIPQIEELLESQDFRCAVTLLPFRNDKPAGMRVRPWAPSIDRIETGGGYYKNNTRIVCCFVNVAMNGFGDQFFSAVLEPLIKARVDAELLERNLV